MNRKNFLIGSSVMAFSLSAFGSIIKTSNREFKGDCKTTNDILGPFYRPDAPIRSNLIYQGLEGNEINIKGRVFKSDCTSPFKEAMVEIWHCDTKGEYDNGSKEFRHRGRAITNDKGEFNFKTILPGKYLNGELYRPSHIHFRISGTAGNELISQIYFQGDPHIDKDPWASQNQAKHRILQIIPEDTFGTLSILFDVYL